MEPTEVVIRFGIGCTYQDGLFHVEKKGNRKTNKTLWLEEQFFVPLIGRSNCSFEEVVDAITIGYNNNEEEKPIVDWTNQKFLILTKTTRNIAKEKNKTAQIRVIAEEIQYNKLFTEGFYEIVITEKNIQSVSSNPRGGNILDNPQLLARAVEEYTKRQLVNISTGAKLANAFNDIVFEGKPSEKETALGEVIKQAAQGINLQDPNVHYSVGWFIKR